MINIGLRITLQNIAQHDEYKGEILKNRLEMDLPERQRGTAPLSRVQSEAGRGGNEIELELTGLFERD